MKISCRALERLTVEKCWLVLHFTNTTPGSAKMVIGGDDADRLKMGIKHVFLRGKGIFPSSHDFSSPKATKRGPWRLFGVLGSSPTPPWVFNLHPLCFPLLGLMRERIYGLEVLMRRGCTIRA